MLRDLSRERLSPDDFEAFAEEVMGGSDRACALVCSSFLENLLKDLVETYFRDDWASLVDEVFDSVNAPIGTFSARITIAYALGAIDEPTKDALTAIRSIRNVFAHSEKRQPFNHKTIAKELRHLRAIDGVSEQAEPRRQYVAACVKIGAKLGTEIGQRRNNLALVKALRN